MLKKGQGRVGQIVSYLGVETVWEDRFHITQTWKTHREASERSPRLCSRRDGLTAIFLGYRNNNKNTMQLYTQNIRLKIGFKNMQMFSQNKVS